MWYLRGFPAFATGKIRVTSAERRSASRQPHRPLQTTLAQSLTERPTGAVPRIGKDASETRARGDDAVDLLDRDLRLCQSGPPIFWHTSPRHALGIICPAFGQE